MRKAFAIFIFSAATLLLEITFTRVLSVSHWHNFAFLVISTALLGFGLSGVLLSALGDRLKRCPDNAPALFALLFAVSGPAALAVGNSIAFDEVMFTMEFRKLCLFLLFYLVYAVPFFFAGCTIGSVIWLEAERVGKIYSANLCGSAIGCLGIFLLLPSLGGVKIVFLCGLAGLASAILFAGLRSRAAKGAALALVAIASLLLYSLPSPLNLRVSQFKALRYYLSLPDGAILETSWNAICRTDVASSRHIRIPPAGLSLNFKGEIPPQIAVTSDADSPSPVTNYSGSRKMLAFSDAAVQSLPYHLGRTGRALIIGAGGGLDILTALYNGTKQIEALEINPDVIDLLENRFAEFSCGLASQPGVKITRGEGRNFLRRSGNRYDVIQIPLFDSIAASSAGVHGFSENYLYTVESFRDCLRRLTPNGILCVTRWIKYPPRECLRVLGLGLAALEAEGVREPGKHLFLIRSWSTTALLVSRSPLTAGEIKIVREFCDEMGFDTIYFPGITRSDANMHNVIKGAPYFRLASGMIDPRERERFYRDYSFDIRPPTDDKPFFYHFLTVRALPRLWKTMGTEWVPFAEWGELVLIAALIQAAIVAVCLSLLPLCIPALRRRHGGLERAETGRFKLLSYFMLLGLAFIFVEITFMQKFVLFLGHPTYAMGVILFSLLLFAGMGSRAGGKIGKRRTLLFLGVVLLIYAYGLSPLLNSLIGLSIGIRLFATVLLVSPPAVLMGTAFPLGIRTANLIAPRLIPWAWAMNGASSVFGAVAAVFVALYTGFNIVLALAAVLYALAFLALAGMENR